MNTYENIVIFNAALSEEELQAAKSKITGLITEAEGKIIRVEDWGARKLAYEINKHKKGYYVLFLFSSPSNLIAKMEAYYKVFDPVIKHMFVRLEIKQLKALEAELRKSEEAAEAAAQANV